MLICVASRSHLPLVQAQILPAVVYPMPCPNVNNMIQNKQDDSRTSRKAQRANQATNNTTSLAPVIALRPSSHNTWPKLPACCRHSRSCQIENTRNVFIASPGLSQPSPAQPLLRLALLLSQRLLFLLSSSLHTRHIHTTPDTMVGTRKRRAEESEEEELQSLPEDSEEEEE